MCRCMLRWSLQCKLKRLLPNSAVLGIRIGLVRSSAHALWYIHERTVIRSWSGRCWPWRSRLSRQPRLGSASFVTGHILLVARTMSPFSRASSNWAMTTGLQPAVSMGINLRGSHGLCGGMLWSQLVRNMILQLRNKTKWDPLPLCSRSGLLRFDFGSVKGHEQERTNQRGE